MQGPIAHTADVCVGLTFGSILGLFGLTNRIMGH
jgi:hypothetical protein